MRKGFRKTEQPELPTKKPVPVVPRTGSTSVDKKLYGFSSFWYPTARGLEAVLLDTGFHNPRLTTGPNTLYSHPRITGSATADPNKTGPRVHSVYKHDFQTDDPMRTKVRRFIIRTI